MKATDPPIIVTQEINASRKSIWAAITEVEHMRKWFFDNIPDYKAEVGFKTRFNVSSEQRIFPHVWEILSIDPLKSKVARWHYEGYRGACTIKTSIEGSGSLHTVKIEGNVIEDFSDDIPEFRRESSIAGWEYFLQKRLKEYLEEG